MNEQMSGFLKKGRAGLLKWPKELLPWKWQMSEWPVARDLSGLMIQKVAEVVKQ